MNLGLGHLTELKAHLLNPSLCSETTFDAAITALGKGVAARFEGHCNRGFGRVVDAIHEFGADRDHLPIRRFPIEAISKIELRETMTTAWVDQGTVNDLVAQIMAEAGMVILESPLGGWADRLRITYTGGFWYPTAPAVVIQSGSVAIGSGGFAADIAFAQQFAGVPSVKCSAISPADAAILAATPYEITASGCTIRLSAATAAEGYTVSWVAIYGDAAAETSIIQEATVDIGAGVGQFDVVFAAAFAAAPIVVCQVVSPAGGYLVACAPSQVTTTGFRALLSWTTDAATYKLAYIAVSPTAAAAAATLPEGATALPDDLKLAWLLQCEHVWKYRDKLGVSVAQSAKTGAEMAGLGAIQLVSEVEATLRKYRRYALT
jgi:hypothetical protein